MLDVGITPRHRRFVRRFLDALWGLEVRFQIRPQNAQENFKGEAGPCSRNFGSGLVLEF